MFPCLYVPWNPLSAIYRPRVSGFVRIHNFHADPRVEVHHLLRSRYVHFKSFDLFGQWPLHITHHSQCPPDYLGMLDYLKLNRTDSHPTLAIGWSD